MKQDEKNKKLFLYLPSKGFEPLNEMNNAEHYPRAEPVQLQPILGPGTLIEGSRLETRHLAEAVEREPYLKGRFRRFRLSNDLRIGIYKSKILQT